MREFLAAQVGRSRWRTVPRNHYTRGHLAAQTTLINPRRVQGYLSEPMVGEMRCTYKQSQSGPIWTATRGFAR
eukprot:10758047-Lingulodinium_polyedra.AAC.1